MNSNIDVTYSSSTTTPNLSDVYSRAFKYDILADRQYFLNKYVNTNIYGNGIVKEISSLGNKYILEIDLGSHSILCPQEKTDDFDRRYPFLKDEEVIFYGIFTYHNYFGYDENKLVIDPCSFESKQ